MKKFERKTVYIYEIDGKEKVTVTSAEEALRWDAIFEVAEQLDQLLQQNPPDIGLDEVQRSDLSLYLAQHRLEFGNLLSTKKGAIASEGKEPADKETPAAIEVAGGKKECAPVKKQPFVQEFSRPVEPSKDGFSL